MTKPIQTPPTHPETEKLIAEFEKKFTAFESVYADKKELTEFIRTALTTSFASGRAQGAREERERIENAFPHETYPGVVTHKTDCRACIVGEAIDNADALKGET